MAVYDAVRLDATGRIMVGRELSVVHWSPGKAPVADLAVVLNVAAVEPKTHAELCLAVMAGEGQYDLARASVSFQILRKRAMVVFELADLDLGPEFWDRAKGSSQLLIRVRPNRAAAPVDRCLPLCPGMPEGVGERALSGSEGQQLVWSRYENPLVRYPRSRF